MGEEGEAVGLVMDGSVLLCSHPGFGDHGDTQRTEGQTVSQAMAVAYQATRCLHPAGPGLFGVHLPGSGLKRVLLHGKCHLSSQNMSPK